MTKRLVEIAVLAFDGCLDFGVLGPEDMLTVARKSRGQGEALLETQTRRPRPVIVKGQNKPAPEEIRSGRPWEDRGRFKHDLGRRAHNRALIASAGIGR